MLSLPIGRVPVPRRHLAVVSLSGVSLLQWYTDAVLASLADRFAVRCTTVRFAR